jgi:plasmid stability protein
MAETPVRHIRVPDDVWAAAGVRAAAEHRSVADVVVRYLRAYGQRELPSPDVVAQAGLAIFAAKPAPERPRPEFEERRIEQEFAAPPDPGAFAETPPKRPRKPPATVTTAAELAKPSGLRTAAVIPGVSYPCCKHCKSPHRGHGDPCLNGCHD